jgi:hypothetical protein
VAEKGGTAIAVIVYTLLRFALFAVVWVLIEFLSPIHGLWAAAAALLISGAISIVVLDRPRNKVGAAAGRFFGGINERIEASARAEDDDEGEQAASGEGQEQSESGPIAEEK